ncbi:hypothetical protein, partial [Pseudoalteromonas fuliginea]|uniref:hypothetical protein n=1 Tax=Pseudoalteromonas fuliginea TaxID=1872678 RepID=UPI00165DAF83
YMNIEQWNTFSDASKVLDDIMDKNPKFFIHNKVDVQIYFIECARKYLSFRSDEIASLGLYAAEKYVKGELDWESFHEHSYTLEGAAFGVERNAFGTPEIPEVKDADYLLDLQAVENFQGINHEKAKRFITNLAYFISSVMDYSYCSDNGLPSNDYPGFICADLLRKRFTFQQVIASE